MAGSARQPGASCKRSRNRCAQRGGLPLLSALRPQITGKNITAKDFRTWAGTVLAAMALNELESFDSAAQAKRNLRAAIEKVADRLSNGRT